MGNRLTFKVKPGPGALVFLKKSRRIYKKMAKMKEIIRKIAQVYSGFHIIVEQYDGDCVEVTWLAPRMVLAKVPKKYL